MKRLILCLLVLVAFFLAWPAEAGPLRSFVRGGCPGGVCPTNKTIEVQAEAIVVPATEKPAGRTWGIIGSRPGACPNCPRIPVYGWIETKPTEAEIDKAASRLAQGGLSREEEKKLAAVIDAPVLKKAIRQELGLGSCGMVCTAHGSKLYNVYEDGSVELAKPEEQSGSSGGAAGRFRLFGRRR